MWLTWEQEKRTVSDWFNLIPGLGYHFGDKVDDKTIRAAADAMVSSGMRDAGYVYVNIDDTWEGTRDAKGNIQPNAKFPDMKALADYSRECTQLPWFHRTELSFFALNDETATSRFLALRRW